MVKNLQWILGISAALSLVLGVIFKLFGVIVLNTGPPSFIKFTVTCSLASMALSLVDLSSKHGIPSGKE